MGLCRSYSCAAPERARTTRQQRQPKPVTPTLTTCSRDSKARRIRTAIVVLSAAGDLPAYLGSKADLRYRLDRLSPRLSRRPIDDSRVGRDEHRHAESDPVPGERREVMRGNVA